MKYLLCIVLLFALQESGCGTAGGIQDRTVTGAKREVDAESSPVPTPTATPYSRPEPSQPEWAETDTAIKMPQRPGVQR